MEKVELKCNACNAPLDLDLNKLSMYCPYCGNKLMFYADDINKLLLEREKTKQAEYSYQKIKSEYDYKTAKETNEMQFIKSPAFFILIAGVIILDIIIVLKGF